ncbi:MAG TPA: hypothetical protein VN420_05415 [Candidatus Fimivivens sp.]|nr:hypothetical protein [Candidatus Fimivivens sp.]
MEERTGSITVAPISSVVSEGVHELMRKLSELPIFHVGFCPAEYLRDAEGLAKRGFFEDEERESADFDVLRVNVYLDRIGQQDGRSLWAHFRLCVDSAEIRQQPVFCPEYIKEPCKAVFGFVGSHDDVFDRLSALSDTIMKEQEWMVG